MLCPMFVCGTPRPQWPAPLAVSTSTCSPRPPDAARHSQLRVVFVIADDEVGRLVSNHSIKLVSRCIRSEELRGSSRLGPVTRWRRGGD